MKLLMIINPKSGTKYSKTHILDAIDVFCANGYDVVTYITQAKNDAYNYLKKNKVKYDIVCVFGGDGTMNEVSNALMGKAYKPLLGYFPSGTMNDFGSNFNLSSDFREIANGIMGGNIQSFDVGELNGSYFNYVAAFGALCDVPYTTNRDSKEMFGSVAYILEGIKKLPQIKSIPLKYEINGKTYNNKVLFGLIYSGSRVAGMQLESKKESFIDDGMFNVLIVDYVPTVLDAPNLLQTLIDQKRHIHRFRTDKISIEFEGDVPWTLDGEEAKVQNKAEIVIHNKALKILV